MLVFTVNGLWIVQQNRAKICFTERNYFPKKRRRNGRGWGYRHSTNPNG